jgi:hypothetical protein
MVKAKTMRVTMEVFRKPDGGKGVAPRGEIPAFLLIPLADFAVGLRKACEANETMAVIDLEITIPEET